MQYFYPFGSPFTRRVLPGGNANFQAGAQALGIALVALPCRDIVAKNDHGVRYLHAAQHAVAALYEDPARDSLLVSRGINHLALESPVNRQDARSEKQKPENEAKRPARLHTSSDARLPARGSLLVVILQPKMGNERFAPQVPQRVLELHRLDKQVVLGIQPWHRHR